jgi:hypothetical protein
VAGGVVSMWGRDGGRGRDRPMAQRPPFSAILALGKCPVSQAENTCQRSDAYPCRFGSRSCLCSSAMVHPA